MLKEKTYQNEKGYFVTVSVYVDVTDDEAEENSLQPLKRKSPSLVVGNSKKTKTSKVGGGKKKQRSLMGFFSSKKKS